MLTSKSLAVSLISRQIAFNSSIALAADGGYADFLPPIWPLFLIIGVIVIFRKQLNCVQPIKLSEPLSEVKVELEPVQAPSSQPVSTSEPEAVPELTTDTIDLKDNSNQCQASTAKGTRCKRKNTLEDASVSIDGAVYLLTACAQHNNDSLRPYSELMK